MSFFFFFYIFFQAKVFLILLYRHPSPSSSFSANSCSLYETASKGIARAMEENDKFAKFVADKRRSGRCRVDLMSYLIMPCQRSMRYPMLVQELLKHTSELHEDHPILELTLAKVREMAKQQNDIDVDELGR